MLSLKVWSESEHPALMTHASLPKEGENIGIKVDYVGLESLDEIQDIEQALSD